MDWTDFQNGACLGGRGTDNGTVLLDKVHPLGGRVTLEEGGGHPWAVTCGVSGAVFVHSMWAQSLDEAESMAASVMEDIGDFLERMESDEVSQSEAIRFAGVWMESFVGKYDGTPEWQKKQPLRTLFPEFFGAG